MVKFCGGTSGEMNGKVSGIVGENEISLAFSMNEATGTSFIHGLMEFDDNIGWGEREEGSCSKRIRT